MPIPPVPTVEDAGRWIVRYLKEGCKSEGSTYGFRLYLPNAVHKFLVETGVVGATDGYRAEHSPPFYRAAWELCRRGILIPGHGSYGNSNVIAGCDGNGYAITDFGEQWLREEDLDSTLPVEPGRLGQMLEASGGRFGAGFIERAQEAVRAYGAHAYFACCAMCGAAAESIMLALAIAKRGDEKAVLDMYVTRNGRSDIEKLVLRDADAVTQRAMPSYLGLLKHWRDSASHGRAVNILEAEAFTSLLLLLRFALFANDRWDTLTTAT